MQGRRFCAAISCARRCFLTVIGWYEPPLTVACARGVASQLLVFHALERRRERTSLATIMHSTLPRRGVSLCSSLQRRGRGRTH